jgi:hypothetical protein
MYRVAFMDNGVFTVSEIWESQEQHDRPWRITHDLTHPSVGRRSDSEEPSREVQFRLGSGEVTRQTVRCVPGALARPELPGRADEDDQGPRGLECSDSAIGRRRCVRPGKD